MTRWLCRLLSAAPSQVSRMPCYRLFLPPLFSTKELALSYGILCWDSQKNCHITILLLSLSQIIDEQIVEKTQNQAQILKNLADDLSLLFLQSSLLLNF